MHALAKQHEGGAIKIIEQHEGEAIKIAKHESGHVVHASGESHRWHHAPEAYVLPQLCL